MTNSPIILVPGFWLGAWAWDEVAETLRADGHDVTALTLPGLESVDADRSSITLNDHVEAICDAVRAAGAPVVLAVHSGAGVPGYGATDRVPELIAHMVYVDTGPATAAMDPDIEGVEQPMPSRRGARGERERSTGSATSTSTRSSGGPCPSRPAPCATRPSSRTTRASTCRARSSPPGTRPSSTARRPRRARPGSAVSPSCATSPTSTCRRATGRCGRARKELAAIIGDIAKAHPSQA